MSICVSEADTGATVEAVPPALRILAADRHKVLSCLCRGQLGEAAVAAGWVVAICSHLSVIVVYLVLQAASRWPSSYSSSTFLQFYLLVSHSQRGFWVPERGPAT